ncbi:MAG: DUF2293 domain-containing protein [Calditrichaeota bacterium]|nr:MAG: DUF2293 domain-containing protein [Calditrichota bacterium]
MSFDKGITVFISNRESTCSECGENLGMHAWITLVQGKGALCLSCADLDHLVFLPSGNAALTRRSQKHSNLSAVVLKWSRNRKRYERQGLLVEDEALEKAEEECLADEDMRAQRRERESLRRNELDHQYIDQFSQRVRELFPQCPAGREIKIAEHACRKYSGRVGRSASAKQMDENAVTLAVTAHIRHAETHYDELLTKGCDRWEARDIVEDKVDDVMTQWRGDQ